MNNTIQKKIDALESEALPLWRTYADQLLTDTRGNNLAAKEAHRLMYGAPAVERAQRKLEVLEARVRMTEVIRAPEQAAQKLGQLTYPDAYKKRLSALFPNLKANEIREVKEALETAGFTFRSSTITGFTGGRSS